MSTTTLWTADRVREELPEVMVEIDGQKFRGQVRGRLNRVATVFVRDNLSFEFAWHTISRALNSNRSLKV